jgi:hypothetical protein
VAEIEVRLLGTDLQFLTKKTNKVPWVGFHWPWCDVLSTQQVSGFFLW